MNPLTRLSRTKGTALIDLKQSRNARAVKSGADRFFPKFGGRDYGRVSVNSLLPPKNSRYPHLFQCVKRHATEEHVCLRLMDQMFSVVATQDSQDFKSIILFPHSQYYVISRKNHRLIVKDISEIPTLSSPDQTEITMSDFLRVPGSVTCNGVLS